MLAPGTRCCSSDWPGTCIAAGPGGSDSIGSPVLKAVVSRSESEGSPLAGVEDSGAETVPTRRSVGTSGWKSSAAGDDAGGEEGASETALAEVLSDEPSVISGPLPIPSPGGCS